MSLRTVNRTTIVGRRRAHQCTVNALRGRGQDVGVHLTSGRGKHGLARVHGLGDAMRWNNRRVQWVIRVRIERNGNSWLQGTVSSHRFAVCEKVVEKITQRARNPGKQNRWKCQWKLLNPATETNKAHSPVIKKTKM